MFENVLPSITRGFLGKLKASDLPKGSYLAGGTAVALYLGHRRSDDLDFFTPLEFVESQWSAKLAKELGFKLIKQDWQTLIGTVKETKISLFGYPDKLIGEKEKIFNTDVASLADLCAMKLDTVIGRGTKRDLVDIYFLAQKFSLEELFRYYQAKYGNFSERELMIRKSLVFFDDADGDEMPQMLVECDWEEVKRWFLREVK